jgi:hypothetical protein
MPELSAPFIRCAAASVTVSSLVLAGCATALDAQWTDPQAAPLSLKGAKVLVVCEADELVVRNICQDRLASQLRAFGVQPALARSTGMAPQPQGGAATHLAAARAIGARAVFATTVLPELTPSRPGFSIGFGLGSFGGRGLGGGVGVSAPVGGAPAGTVYGANAVLTDVTTGRPTWTAKAPGASGDVNGQVERFTEALVNGAQKAGFLPPRP